MNFVIREIYEIYWICLSCLLLFSCASNKEYQPMKGKVFWKKSYIESDCFSTIYRWKQDSSFVDGEYKLRFKKKYSLLRHFEKGELSKSMTYYRKTKTDETIYSGPGDFITTLYNKKRLLFLGFDNNYDSLIYYYQKKLLQKVEYYIKENKFETTVTYSPGIVIVNSVSDNFFFDYLVDGSFTDCSYDLLMKDPKTNAFYKKIEIVIKEPSLTTKYIYTPNDDKYHWIFE